MFTYIYHLAGGDKPQGEETHLFQHDLGVVKVLEHGLDISLIGRPRQEAARDSLHALHVEDDGGNCVPGNARVAERNAKKQMAGGERRRERWQLH